MADLKQSVQTILDNSVKVPTGPAGVVFGAVDKTGRVLVNEAAGVRAVDKADPMTPDTVFCLFSTTKILATVACLQAVEQGKLTLDDPIGPLVPEVSNAKIIDKDGNLTPPKNKITLRMLLSHTAGFAYTFFDERINEWYKKSGVDEFDGKLAGVTQPLIFEPGTSWFYGVNIDWAGQALERATGKTLGQWCKEHIFDPLGLEDISFSLTPAMRARLAGMHQRTADGKLAPRPHFPYVEHSEFDSGGAGAFGTIADYLQCLVPLINAGRGANGAQILRPETVVEMYRDQTGHLPDALEITIPNPRADLSHEVPIMPGVGKGWGLSFLLTKDPLPTGRSANSAWWAGLANLYYTVDPHKGVANFIATQTLPFNDLAILGTWLEAEKAVYDSL
ncbi:hypothetical protein JCM21900_002361 [Sporobolomyces salmonicolor]